MPNWVRHKLTVKGKIGEVDKLVNNLKGIEEEAEGFLQHIDFNKIIPMPKELNIVSGSTTDKCVEIYLASLNPKVKDFGAENKDEKLFIELRNSANKGKAFGRYDGELSKQEIEAFVEKHKGDEKLNTLEDFINYGKKAIDNTLKFGSMDWYSWSIANWGTKWNACHVMLETRIDNDIQTADYYFDTAWGDVRGLIEILASQYPTLDFELKYSEEQMGHYVGFGNWENGECVYGVDLEDYSKEAYDIAFELWGEDSKEYYRFNEETGTYEYFEEEED
jgi:hypothetical protein